MNAITRILLLVLSLIAQEFIGQGPGPYRVHSHNDYHQNVPFWTAFVSGCQSIEADLFLKDGTLYVTHEEGEIIEGRSLERLYLDPLSEALQLKYGPETPIQLLLDIKSRAKPTLKALINSLKAYPDLIADPRIRFVISGNRPRAQEYDRYPDFILFDYQSLEGGDEIPWEKVALVSLSFRNFSGWNGLGRLTHEDKERVQAVIDSAHELGKPFRFWATPDGKTAWHTLTAMGVDFVNTDQPVKAMAYLSSWDKNFTSSSLRSTVYEPLFAFDADTRPRNVILLIGDGNGLAQISGASEANGGSLTLLELSDIGLVRTSSADDYVTDSAAGATAIATGHKTNNRAIGTDRNGLPIRNLTEILDSLGYASALISTDHITGATPASFYAHRVDRSNTEGIASDLMASTLGLFMGGGASEFPQNTDQGRFRILDSMEQLRSAGEGRFAFFFSPRGVPGIRDGRGELLPKATREALTFLERQPSPFFLMVEGAQIDSYGHANDPAGILEETIDFDRAVTEAIRFADTNPYTLVIVTADHETGGFSLLHGDPAENRIEGAFTTNDHTGTMIPLFAYGPGSHLFRGVYENSEIFDRILLALGLNPSGK